METVLKKASNLILPTIGYELDREEMSYVDGGGIPTWFVSGVINTALCVIGGAIALKAAAKASKVAMEKAGAYYAKKSVASFIKALGIKGSAEILAGTLIDILVVWFDPVAALVNWWDGLDGRSDGWIGKKGWFNW